MWPEVSFRLSGLGRIALLKGDLDAALEGLAGVRSLAGEHAAAGEAAEKLLADAEALFAEAAALRASAGVPLPAAERRDVDRGAERIAARGRLA